MADSEYAECSVCGDYYAIERFRLGYTECLKHGAKRRVFTIVPVPKSNYIIAKSAAQVRSPYSHKGTGNNT